MWEDPCVRPETRAVMTLWCGTLDANQTRDDEMGRWIEMLGNMDHDCGRRHRGSRIKRLLVQKLFGALTYRIPQTRYNACNKYHKSATHLPEICIWQWKRQMLRWGSEAALISLLSPALVNRSLESCQLALTIRMPARLWKNCLGPLTFSGKVQK